MSETKNYGLYLNDDSQEFFLDWRNKMNGPEGSNMVKIDEILAGKADSSTVFECVLLSSAWQGQSAPFTQKLSIETLTEEQNGYVVLSSKATSDEETAARKAALMATGQGDGELTISARGTKPDIDIPVAVFVLG